MTNIELFVGLRFTDKNGFESIFTKGDTVVCHLKDGTRYKGILSFAGLYQDNDDPEPFNIICIYAPKSKMSYTMEFIRFTDIDYLHKTPSI